MCVAINYSENITIVKELPRDFLWFLKNCKRITQGIPKLDQLILQSPQSKQCIVDMWLWRGHSLYHRHHCRQFTLDWSDGQLFVPMEWWWSYFPNAGMAMVFENVSPSPSMVFGGINHRQQWFFDGFSNFLDQWLTMVTKEKRVFCNKINFTTHRR